MGWMKKLFVIWLALAVPNLFFHIKLHPLFFVLFGGIGLWLCSDFIIDAVKRVAKAIGISELLIALTVVSIGTSLPEISTNIFSGIKVMHGIADASGIAIGTNIGSDIFQITFVLGFTGIIACIHTTKRTLYQNGFMVLFSIVLFWLVSRFFGNKNGGYFITRWEGFIILAIYIAYLYYIAKKEHTFDKFIISVKNKNKDNCNIPLNIFFMIFGLSALLLASKLVVENALVLMDLWQVKSSFIGVLIVGTCSALPELSTSITAVLKKAKDISLGTIIGSNITDPLMSTGIGAMIAGFNVTPSLMWFDLPFWFIASIIALLLIRRKRLTLNRKEAIILVFLYFFFVFLKIEYGA